MMGVCVYVFVSMCVSKHYVLWVYICALCVCRVVCCSTSVACSCVCTHFVACVRVIVCSLSACVACALCECVSTLPLSHTS